MGNCSNNIITNFNGTPYLQSSNITVTDTAVDIALGFFRVAPFGDINIRIASAIPEGTTGTLPVTLTLNGTSRPLTFFGGAPVTAADLAGTGVITVFNDRLNGILQIKSVTAPAAQAAQTSQTNG